MLSVVLQVSGGDGGVVPGQLAAGGAHAPAVRGAVRHQRGGGRLPLRSGAGYPHRRHGDCLLSADTRCFLHLLSIITVMWTQGYGIADGNQINWYSIMKLSCLISLDIISVNPSQQHYFQ